MRFVLPLVSPKPLPPPSHSSLNYPLVASKINFTNFTKYVTIPTMICSQGRCNVDTELLLAEGDGNNESRAYSPPPPLPSRPGLERPGGDRDIRGGKTLVMA